MINVIELNVYNEHMARSLDSVKNAQWQDQFIFEIVRESPSTGIIINPEDVISCSINYDGINSEPLLAGSSIINLISGVESLSVSVVFRDSADNKIIKFLKLRDDGKSIMPRDGTFLLPYQYYFYLRIKQLNSKWEETPLLRGEFLLDGQSVKDFVTDGGEMMGVSAEFKPIFSNRIRFD